MFDIDIRFFSALTGLRLQASPEDILSASWEFVEAGGTSQIAIELARPFDDLAWSVNGGDIVEIWALGETVPRCRGRIGQYEKSLDLQEKYTLTAYGLMEDMNRVLLNEIILIPGGADLSQFAAGVADDYAARRPDFEFMRDFQDTDVSLERLELSKATARAAMDQIASQSGGNVVWGWDIDPVTNLDRFYLRPKSTSVGHQWFVGGQVKLINAPQELQGIVNGGLISGGPSKYPQLLTNPDFEVPELPNEASGSLLTDGSFERNISWNYESGASRVSQHDISAHNTSAHSGNYYALLDHNGEEIWQEVAITPITETYTASLFASRESGSYASAGSLILEGRNSSGAVLETFTLPIAPDSTAWTGGQASTVLAADAIQLYARFLNASSTVCRLRVVASNGSNTEGLCIDDVTFAQSGTVGQTGWFANSRTGAPTETEFEWIDWACRQAAWNNAYGVRAKVTPTSDWNPVIEPYPGVTSSSQGYHFKPAPQQALRVGAAVRMAPGLNTSAGEIRPEYYEWNSGGKQTQNVNGTGFTVPNDGAWHFVYIDVTAHGDASTATMGITFKTAGIYDLDAFTARDQAAHDDADGGQNYISGTNFELYVTAEEVCDPGSNAYNSYATYGRQESAISNPAIVDWNDDAKQWAKAYFERNAVPLERPNVEIVDEQLQIPSPGEGTQVRISGLNSDLQDWCAKASYSWKSGQLAISLDLSNERPTWAKLLTNLSASGGGSASTIASVARQGAAAGSGGGGTSTPAQAAIAVDDGATTVTGATQLHFVGATVAADTAAGIADITFSGSGASAATASALGTVETDVTETTPIVYTKATSDTLLAAKEPSLGDPSADGYVLSSTAAGVRSWVAQGGGSYTLPTASSSVLGGVKIGSGLSIAGGVVSVNAAPSSGASIEGADAAGSSAALPDAASTSAMLGWVNPGNSGDGNITISAYLSQTIKTYSAGAWGAVSSVSIPPGGHMFFVPAGSTSWLAFS